MHATPRPISWYYLHSPDVSATAALAKQQVKAGNIAQEQLTSQYISHAALLPGGLAGAAGHTGQMCCIQRTDMLYANVHATVHDLWSRTRSSTNAKGRRQC